MIWLDTLCKNGFLTKIDVFFAKFIGEISESQSPDLLLAAALASSAAGKKHVCLSLESMKGKSFFDKQTGKLMATCPDLSHWRETLLNSLAVGQPGQRRPLILDDKNRLYLFRYWNYEKIISDSIQRRIRAMDFGSHPNQLKEAVQQIFPLIFPPGTPADPEQKNGAIMAAQRAFCVISGGPGTGKTFAAASIMGLLLAMSDENKLKVCLCAPTGKAAARLSESVKKARETLPFPQKIKDAMPEEARTIHRLLRPIRGTSHFYYNKNRRLSADLIIVDEASMMDVAMAAAFFQAAPDHARIVLMGDKDQLSSVEAGSVLGDICAAGVSGSSGLSGAGFSESGLSGPILSETLSPGLTSSGWPSSESNDGPAPDLANHLIMLKKSHRFTGESGVGRLCAALNAGDGAAALAHMGDATSPETSWKEIETPSRLFAELSDIISRRLSDNGLLDLSARDPLEALASLSRFRILCAVRNGPFGVTEINRFVRNALARKGLIAPMGDFYPGKPIMITKNDYEMGLFNGDTGIIMDAGGLGKSGLCAWFPALDGTARPIPLSALPAHEAVYAMTAHKSQGSEFDDVTLILPNRDSPILTRELLYTGATRAMKRISIWGFSPIFKTALGRKVERMSGLTESLSKQEWVDSEIMEAESSPDWA